MNFRLLQQKQIHLDFRGWLNQITPLNTHIMGKCMLHMAHVEREVMFEEEQFR